MEFLEGRQLFGLSLACDEQPPDFRDIDASVIYHPVMHLVYLLSVGFFLAHFAVLPFVRACYPKDKRGVADLVTFDIVAGVACTYLSVVGMYTFYFADRPELEDKLHGFDPLALHIAQVMLAYQFYDLFIIAFVPQLFTWAMVVHHVLSGTLGFIGLFNYAHGFAAFFFGVIEVSNIVLTAVDFFKHGQLDKAYPKTYTFVRMMFALSFLVFRLILWPYECYKFWTVMFHGFSGGALLTSNHDVFGGVMFLFANLALTFLQFYWGTVIIRGVFKAIKKLNAKKAASNGKKSK